MVEDDCVHCLFYTFDADEEPCYSCPHMIKIREEDRKRKCEDDEDRSRSD